MGGLSQKKPAAPTGPPLAQRDYRSTGTAFPGTRGETAGAGPEVSNPQTTIAPRTSNNARHTNNGL
jgi:hypothetical protein